MAEDGLSAPATAPPCTTCYLMADHLGSTRMITDAAGNQAQLFDYMPFGEVVTSGMTGRDGRWGPAGAGLHFTGALQEGYEGDYLHYFGARFFSGGQGRFGSADEPFAGSDPSDPQSWNLYGYALNNPLVYTDPTGYAPCVKNVNPETGNICTTVTEPGGLGSLEVLLLDAALTPMIYAHQAARATQRLAAQAADWLSRPRDVGCLYGNTAAGAVAGGAGGAAVGLAGGPFAEVTVPAGSAVGFLGGGIAGGVRGLISCMSTTEPSSGGGGDSKGGGTGESATATSKNAGKTVEEILKGKKGSIKNAEPEPGSPSWDAILKTKWEDIVKGAKACRPGYDTLGNS